MPFFLMQAIKNHSCPPALPDGSWLCLLTDEVRPVALCNPVRPLPVDVGAWLAPSSLPPLTASSRWLQRDTTMARAIWMPSGTSYQTALPLGGALNLSTPLKLCPFTNTALPWAKKLHLYQKVSRGPCNTNLHWKQSQISFEAAVQEVQWQVIRNFTRKKPVSGFSLFF